MVASGARTLLALVVGPRERGDAARIMCTTERRRSVRSVDLDTCPPRQVFRARIFQTGPRAAALNTSSDRRGGDLLWHKMLMGRHAVTSVPELLTYPLMPVDVPRAIDRIADWVSDKKHQLVKQFSLEWLETELRKGLREGRLTLTIMAIHAAEKHDDEIADAALRAVYAEMVGGTLPQRGPGHLQLAAYGQRAVLQAPLKRGRGQRWHDNWFRNIQICFLIELACREFGVRATRNRETRRADRHPSGISLIVAGLARNGLHIDEASVQENLG